MKKLLPSLVLAGLIFSNSALAQKGSKQIGIAAELAIPTFDSFGNLENPGIGASVKGLYGVSAGGYATITLGYVAFPQESNYGLLVALQPVLIGYRQSFKRLYAEGQGGFNNYRISSDYFKNNYGQFAWAAGVGYQVKAIDISGRFQSGHSNYKTSSFFALRVGYNFMLKKDS